MTITHTRANRQHRETKAGDVRLTEPSPPGSLSQRRQSWRKFRLSATKTGSGRTIIASTSRKPKTRSSSPLQSFQPTHLHSTYRNTTCDGWPELRQSGCCRNRGWDTSGYFQLKDDGLRRRHARSRAGHTPEIYFLSLFSPFLSPQKVAPSLSLSLSDFYL